MNVLEINNKLDELRRKKEGIISKSLTLSNNNNDYKTAKELESNKDLNVACVLDEFSYNCFKHECNLIKISLNNWKNEIENFQKIDFLFVESAWNGNDGSWQYQIAKYNTGRDKLIDLIEYCRNYKIPTVFWNKEDPVHFNRFIETAELFDYIFTTDKNCINKYKQITGNANVFSLPFAAQPQIHNPIKFYERSSRACFAGTFYNTRYPERKKEMEQLLDIIIKYGLDIYDRNFYSDEEEYRFPKKYNSFIQGNLKYNQIQKAYKGYKVLVNFNSVIDSPTMFSRRVLEGMASNTPVISTYAKGIEKLLSKEAIRVFQEIDELKVHIHQIMTNSETYEKTALRGVREVISKHTYEKRLDDIIGKINIRIKKNSNKVSVIGIVNSFSDISKLIKMFELQIYNEKELIIILDGIEDCSEIINKYNDKNIKSYIYNYLYLHEDIKNIITGEYITYFNIDNYYFKNYLTDLMLAIKYTKSEIIGKNSYFEQIYNNNSIETILIDKEQQYVYTQKMRIDKCIINKVVFNEQGIVDVIKSMKNNIELHHYFKRGKRIFSIDKFNFISNCKSICEINEVVSRIDI